MTEHATTALTPTERAATELAITPGASGDWPGITRLLATVFHGTVNEEGAWGAVFEPDRSLLVKDEGEVVAHAGAFTRELSVPGATVPAAHVTMVGVAPTHRRQRLLTRLMRRQLREVQEPLAVLWASEGQIYPRFGYGQASQRVSLRVETREVRLPEPATPGRLQTVPVERARPGLREVYEAVRPDRPGWSSRGELWWDRRLADPPDKRDGGTELRATLHTGPDGVTGYALWRTKSDWGPTGPQGEVKVLEVVAADPDTYLRLWRFLLSIDLTRYASFWLAGPGEPLLQLASEPRRLGAVLGDGLYVRIVDVPAALAARRYPTALDTVLEVTDPLLAANTGRWRLTTDGGKASCVRTDDAADLALSVTDLAAVYLGGTSLGALAAAGRVRELRPDTLAPAAAGFGWHRAPAGIEIF